MAVVGVWWGLSPAHLAGVSPVTHCSELVLRTISLQDGGKKQLSSSNSSPIKLFGSPSGTAELIALKSSRCCFLAAGSSVKHVEESCMKNVLRELVAVFYPGAFCFLTQDVSAVPSGRRCDLQSKRGLAYTEALIFVVCRSHV